MLSQIHLFMCTAYFCLAFWEAGRKGRTFLKKSVAFCGKTNYTENVENEKRVNKIDWEVRIMRLVLLTALGIGGATVIGALLGFMFRKIPDKWHDGLMGFAAGVMLSMFGGY